MVKKDFGDVFDEVGLARLGLFLRGIGQASLLSEDLGQLLLAGAEFLGAHALPDAVIVFPIGVAAASQTYSATVFVLLLN